MGGGAAGGAHRRSPGRHRTRRRKAAGCSRRLAILGCFILVAAWLAGCGAPGQPVEIYDTRDWPPFDRFVRPAALADQVHVAATVTVTGELRPGPDPQGAAGSINWRTVVYDITITPAGGRTLKGVVAGVRLNEAMAPWIWSGQLDFGSGKDAPVDLGPGPGQSRGLSVGRQSAIPDPGSLSPDQRRTLKAALQTPIWMKLTWDGVPRYIRLEPGEDIRYVGLEVLEAD